MRRSHRSASARTRTSSICTTTCKPRLPPMETTLALAFCQLLMIGIPMRIEIDVDKDRLWGDLTSLATFTAPDSDEGVTRRAWSREYFAAEDWLTTQMRQAGLDVEVDAARNIWGTWDE